VAGVVPASAVCVGGGAQWHAHAVAAAQEASGHLMVKEEQWSKRTMVEKNNGQTIQSLQSKRFMVRKNGQKYSWSTNNIVQ
jgi:hypothetical protein